MSNFDVYWMSNREWWEFKGSVATVKEDAPPEAQESYRRFQEEQEKKRSLRAGCGEYDPPLPEREKNPSEIEKAAARNLLLAYRERAVENGRPTGIYDELLVQFNDY